MVDINTLLDLQIAILLLMLTGYILTKIKTINHNARESLTDMLINLILPCNIIVSFLTGFDRDLLFSFLSVIVVSICVQIFSTIIGNFAYSKKDERKTAVLKYATVVSNAGFMGNPIVYGIYGSQGLLFASLYLIPLRIIMWSYGVSCFTGVKGKGALKKVLTHPCIVAVYIGLALSILEIPVPSGISKTLGYLSSCNTALSMIVIGNILAETHTKGILNRQSLWYCFIRLIFIPSMVLIACKLVGLDKLIASVAVVLSGMPAGATTAILASKHKSDDALASQLVVLSTVLSVVTIPIMCLIVNHVVV